MKISPLFLTLILTGCSTSKNLAPPTVTFEKILSSNRWWEKMGDPLMTSLTKELIAQNIDIQIADARLRQAEGNLEITNSGFFPNLSLDGSASRGNDRIGYPKPLSIARGGFDANWEIDLFGQIRNAASAAQYRAVAAKISVEDVTNSVIGQLFRAIIDWRQANEVLKATKALITAQEKQVSLFKDRTSAGLIDRSFEDRARAELSQTATDLPLAQASKDRAQYTIERLMGKNPGELSELLTDDDGHLLLPNYKPLLDINIDVIRQRPDVRAARAQMLAAESDLAKAESDLWPTISVGAFFGVQHGTEGVPLATNPVWSAVSSLTAPLFNFGRLRGAIHVADAQKNEAFLNYQNTLLIALEECHTALTDYMNGLAAVDKQQEALDYRNQTIQLTLERFNRGLTDMVDLTTAQSELNRATILLIQLKSRTTVAYIRLQKALGTTFLDSYDTTKQTG